MRSKISLSRSPLRRNVQMTSGQSGATGIILDPLARMELAPGVLAPRPPIGIDQVREQPAVGTVLALRLFFAHFRLAHARAKPPMPQQTDTMTHGQFLSRA